MNDIRIDSVFFAQTHVLRPGAPFFKLVGNRDTLIKVHVLSGSGCDSPTVEAVLTLDDETVRIPLEGPAVLPEEFCSEPGKVIHRYEDCFTAIIPSNWIKRGLKITVQAGELEHVVEDLEIGPPLALNMTMFDIHYFDYEDADYPDGWEEEFAARYPVSEFNVQRLKRILFPELVIPPRADLPAVRCTCTDDYLTKTGQPFNGKQAAAIKWYTALQLAGGQHRLTAFFVSICNVAAGGEAWDFGGSGKLGVVGILNHEMGHVLGVEDLCCEGGYPYRGRMFGIDGMPGYHAGPTWAFDPRRGFVTPILSEHTTQGEPGHWRKDPLWGGGHSQEPDEMIAHYSDYCVRKMQEYMERHMVIWDEDRQGYFSWNHYTGSFFNKIECDGFSLPLERDVEVYSVMVAVSAVTEEGNFIYEVIGPYRSGLLDAFDPEVEEDRKRARKLPVGSWDISLRIVQGGVAKTFMMPIAWRPDEDPLDLASLKTRALNVPVSDGTITHAELLLTPEASVNGLPDTPTVLYAREL